ncbi:hypothetical protein FBZ98_10648 [Rhizobium sp. ERR 922]|nr:hypothetical protein FBZ98_10648 [Rhizobium sp. ERR 922]TWB92447.1 hypothetical protein FBZ97_10648 [Rhizobium sp. ERR 942]
MFRQLSKDDRSIRHDSVYLEIGQCVAAVARGTPIHDLQCSSTIHMAVAFIVGARVWNANWSDEAIWRMLDRWQRLAVFDHGVHPTFATVALDDTLGV